jgi:thioredoxin-like negative regulator of GroEL
MITLGIGIPHYIKYLQQTTTMPAESIATSLATEGKISVASIIPVNSNTELQDLIAQSMTQPLMVKIMKINCGACQRMLNPYAIAAGNFQDKVIFAEIDYNQYENKESLRSWLHLTEVPTFIGYKNGKEVLRFSGVRSQEQLTHTLHRLIDSE